MGVYVLGKRVQGASHIRSGTPCQDSFKVVSLDDGTIILAVADGHGSKKCLYSEVGSEIAVNVFCSVLEKLYKGFADNPNQLLTYLNREGDMQVAMSIDAEWKDRIKKRHKRHKLEIDKLEDGTEDWPSVFQQYGSTLLGLMITDSFVFGFQLGDGDICYVTEDGFELVVEPDKILGVETHSLSRADSWKKAITVVRRIDVTENVPAMFSLSSDGYANSYKSEEEFRATIRDYLGMLNEHGPKAVFDNLADWLSETSAMGCGDDITMVIAYYPKDEQAVSEESEVAADE